MKKNIAIVILSVLLAVSFIWQIQPEAPVVDVRRYVDSSSCIDMENLPMPWNMKRRENRRIGKSLLLKLREQAAKYPEDFVSLQEAESKNSHLDDAYVTLLIQYGLEKYWNE